MEEIYKECEVVFEEFGISIEKGFIGLYIFKKMFYFVNLLDDLLLVECLVYNFKFGIIIVGNVDINVDYQVNICLNGMRILYDYCVFENGVDGIVMLIF